MSAPASRQQVFLQEMGIGPAWRLRERAGAPELAEAAVVAEPVAGAVMAYAEQQPVETLAATGNAVAAMNWDELKSEVASCVKCTSPPA